MSYKGTPYHIPLINGRNNNSNQAQKSPSDLETAYNIALHEGTIQKDFGEVNLQALPLGDPIRAGFDYYPTPSSQRTVVYEAVLIQKSSGTGSGAFSALSSALTADSVAQFVQGGRETTNANPRLFFFNGVDFPQYIDGDASATERVGFRGSLTNAFDTTSGDATLTINHTAHGLTTGDTVSLVGFTNPLNGQNPNVSNASVTVIGANQFSVEAAGNFNANSTGVGGTGKYYAHPVDWNGTTQPSGGVILNDRLIVFMGQSIYASDPTDHDNFEVGAGVDSAVVYSGIGSEIRAIATFQNRLIVFKYPTGIIQIDDLFGANQQNYIAPVQLGIAGKNSFCYSTDGDLIFISNFGSIHSLSAVFQFGDIKASSLTETAFLDRELKANVDMSKLNKSCMAFDPYNKVAYAAMTKKSSTHNDLIVKVDLSQGRPRISYTEKGNYVALWVQKDSNTEERIVAGTHIGYIRNMNAEARQSDGSGGTWTSRFRTAYTDLRDQFPQIADRNKHFDYLEFSLQPTDTDIDLSFNIYVDGNLEYSTNTSAQTEALVFPITFPATFGSDSPRPVQIPLRGCYGRTISIECINVSNEQNFKISDFKIKFRPGDERILAS